VAKRKRRATSFRESVTQPISDSPWYVRAIAFIGVPSAIAVFLVYFLTNLFTAITTRLEAIEVAQRSAVQVSSTLLKHLEQDTESMWQLVSINQRTCLNTAKSDADRMACVIARKPQ
jgi:hypothetical protein